MPKVSVLMPVYKTDENYLREAIESILSQTFEDFEFLILDDCPEDDREEIIKSYKDKRIKYYKNEKNLGITPSRNKLIDMAKGEYLAIFDHDDISLPTRLEKQVAYLDEHPECGVVGCKTQRMSNGKQSKNPTNDHEIKLALMRVCALTHPASMIRKSVLINNNIRYEERFSPAEDYALWCRLIGKTKFYNIPKVLMKYRIHDNNTTKTQSDKMSAATRAIHEFVRAKHPDIWKNVCQNTPHLIRMKLFGIIPLGRFRQIGNNRKGILKYLPFITIKTKLEVK